MFAQSAICVLPILSIATALLSNRTKASALIKSALLTISFAMSIILGSASTVVITCVPYGAIKPLTLIVIGRVCPFRNALIV